ncbi:hypothetical protein [Nostoc sp.]|uniref:hypothetical protein n=1 Tax=Nostoc sp. TaxID=1180 RepID=UPI002FFC3886
MIAATKHPVKSIFLLFSNLSDNWNIAKKISYGYTLAVSIAFIGTTKIFGNRLNKINFQQKK